MQELRTPAGQGDAGRTASLGGRNRIARSRILAVVVLVLIAGLAGYVLGTIRSGASIHTGRGYSAEGAISLIGDDERWVYAVPLDVSWTDAQNSRHDGGRPACLPSTGVEVGPITFAATEVSVGGVKWRQVVWVSCRSEPERFGN